MRAPDWDAETYHRVSEPQWNWGKKVLEELELDGDEVVLDAGCGTGRLTALLAERLPRGRVVALDASPAMLAVARQTLAPFGERVSFVQGDLGRLDLDATVDVVFSTATFHWVRDHAALYRGIAGVLRPRGRVHVQYGGHGNLSAFHHRASALMREPAFAEHFVGFEEPYRFETVEQTSAWVTAAGLHPRAVYLTPAPASFADSAAMSTFVTNVVLRHHLARLPEALRARFVEAAVRRTHDDTGGYGLDYVRLDVRATR